MSDRARDIADLLRGRILRGLHAGTVQGGDRLPGSRELALEFDVDHRVVLTAYRELAADGMVEMRPRGGIYVSRTVGEQRIPLPSSTWLTEIFAQGVSREIPVAELYDWMRRAVQTLRLRAVVLHRTSDQIVGLCRELRDYYGLDVSGLEADRLDEEDTPLEVRHADLLLTTSAYETPVRSLAERLGKKVIVLDLRPDLIGGEWRFLLRQTVYVVVRDEGFVPVIQDFFAGIPGAENIRPIVLGVDSLESIPEGAPVYVTSSARELLGDQPFRGRLLPTARLLSNESTMELIRFIIEANFRALTAWRKEV